MKTKVATICIISMLLLSGFFGISMFNNENAEATMYYVGGTGGGNSTTIQAAIDKASIGDTVYVYAGTYKENVYINKSISLIGESDGNTTIDAGGVKDAIQINVDWVNISGFRIINGGKNSMDAGIELNRAKNCSIMNNNISSNGYYGIYSTGMKSQEFNNRIENNIISLNNYSGISLYLSFKNYVINNIIKGNNIFNSNTDGGIKIYLFSNNNNITGNTIENNKYTGVLCYSSHNNILKFNKISNNPRGIYFPTSALDNIIYLNDFTSNTNHYSGSVSSNIWNSTEKITYYYNNTNFTNNLGNYWDDYSGNDINGDGIGDTSYSVGSTKDYYPLMKSIDSYTLIPPSIDVEMDASYWRSKNQTVKLVAQAATLNVTVSGDLDGYINFIDLEFVTIDSGLFKGKGFFTANWTAIVEGLPYQGTWEGMLFKTNVTRRIYLKGTIFGGLHGITDGYLIESTKNSSIYNQFNSTMTINQLGPDVIFAQPLMNGAVNYQKSVNSTSEIYILQALFKGNCTGYYNQSLSVVLTHVRINNVTHPYYGQGFSIISYVSKLGVGLGWTYDKTVAQNVVSMTGWFTKPLWGIVFGTLDETGTVKKLSLTILRLEMGLPPKALLDIKVWGPHMLYPGQTVNYFLEFTNIGTLSGKDTEIVMTLPNNSTYVNCTNNGIYNNITHQITWRQNISAKSKTLICAKVNISWGLKRGLKLYCNGSIIDFIKNITLVSDSYNSSILSAKDPNVKYGPEGFVIPGETLNYKIEFENEGEGTAYGVYFIDTLSEYLDDSTLKIGSVISTGDSTIIGPKGFYNQDTRTITWFVGELGSGEGGYAEFSLHVRDDAVSGMEILNYGIVYFPSVPEVTRTNGILSTVTINKNPIAVAGKNLVVKTLEEIIFDGSGSSDLDGDIINYTWDFGDGGIGYGKVISYSYLDDGNYKVKLTVLDNWGGSGVHEILIQVKNRIPEAKLVVELPNVNTNDEVGFDAGNSLDLDGDVVEYFFDFGDGSDSGWVQTTTASHRYLDGTKKYTVKLNVKDDDGATNENLAEVTVTVNNRGPMAELSADRLEAFTYEDILFKAELSSDLDGEISSYYFDFGDGIISDWVTTSEISHQYSEGQKEYDVQLYVRDDDGESDTTHLFITIKNRGPEAVAGSDLVVDTNQLIKFNGGLSTDMDGRIKSYNWAFGDGTSSSRKVASHSYNDNGKYTVTLTVTDDDGATAKDTCTVTVNNMKPIADFTINPETGDVTSSFEFSSASYDTDGFITHYYWDFGDGSTSEQENPSHKYENSGTFEVSLKVKDDDGLESDVITKEITFTNLPPVAIAKSSIVTAKITEKIEFDATGSYDKDGEIINIIWQFGDGNLAYDSIVEHSYDKIGTYTVILEIIDDSDNNALTSLEIIIFDEILDSDGDGLTDDIDPDDDNDGLPDTWEVKYGLNTVDQTDADQDLDEDSLLNIDEYLHLTNPTLADTDHDGLSDYDEITIYNTNPTNPDTDGDSYNDKVDAYPNDDTMHEKQSPKEDSDIQIFMILIIIILIIIIAIIPIVIRKKRHNLIGEPYSQDKALRDLTFKVLKDPDGQNLRVSRDKIKMNLETSHSKGEISEETYKYINENILYSEEGKQH
jgi:parallel beta-helix repeat protein